MKNVVYVSTDGVLEPIGHSQISSLLYRLSHEFAFTVISLEKHGSLTPERVEEQRAEYQSFGIAWRYATYEYGAAGAAKNLARLALLATAVCAESEVHLLHARSYLAGFVSMQVGRLFGIPFVFDFRGYWVDEKLQESNWFDSPLALRFGREVERSLFQRATVNVSLAEPGAEDIRRGKFGPAAPVYVIPTCVDENAFGLRAEPSHDKLRFGYVGSINRSYLVEETLTLAAKLCALDSRVEFVGITHQVSELSAASDRYGIPVNQRRIFSAHHHEMPTNLQGLDWGFLLLAESDAKRASMPTKLGELLASGVRPIQCGCNSEVESWVRKTESGIIANDLTDAGLDRLALEILASRIDYGSLRTARKIALSHFGLTQGCERYREVYDFALSASAR